ncbi:MAG: tRNA 2-thiocytidine biosynthesis TtcA family protein [Spirochaetales bacterium]
MKKILSQMRKACEDYEMIKDGDKIAVGISGGKDSLTLLKALKMYSIFSPQKFTIEAIMIDMFNGKTDTSKLKEWCKELDINLHVINSNIYEVLFEERKETNPCSLCSKMRKGALNEKALELGCNKVALGHHADDFIETFFLSMFYEGRLSSFHPVNYLDRTGLTIIRPLLYVKEKDIVSASNRNNLPVIKNACPADKHTQREYVKDLLNDIKKDIPFVKDRIHSALIHTERYNLLDKINYGKDEEDNN